jgi:tetraprenyl-beta-curcumene synthase
VSEVRGKFAEQRLMARAGIALMMTNARYWTSVAPLVRAQLAHWERRAREIDDPELRALALAKLREQGFTAEAAAMLATLAPRAHRRQTVQAIVALEVMYDYLDGLNEQPSPDPLGEGERLFGPLIEAVQAGGQCGQEIEPSDGRANGGYIDELSRAVRSAVAQLPANHAIGEAALLSAQRSAGAQIRMHATPTLGGAQLQQWAQSATHGGDLQWRELLAGAASSVICTHALIAAAADERTTPRAAAHIDAAYLSISALGTLLDSLIDYEEDQRSGELAFIDYYESPEELARALTEVVRDAASRARSLPDGAHHVMMLVGLVAYFTSAPGANSQLARPIAASLHTELRPLIGPTLVIMRAWRLAKRARCASAARRVRGRTARDHSPGSPPLAPVG